MNDRLMIAMHLLPSIAATSHGTYEDDAKTALKAADALLAAAKPGESLAPDPGAHLHNCPATSMRCPVCPKSGPQACEQPPAPPTPTPPPASSGCATCGHPAETHIECIEFTSTKGCFTDACWCEDYRNPKAG